ncbi:MAG: FMN-binding glutamate synthase family protein [Pseudomonadota bacterium]|nr:FMN-binding glutamate synthase family protein [Pseudomonadota bacterium]
MQVIKRLLPILVVAIFFALGLWAKIFWLAGLSGFFVLVGIYNLIQKKHAILRNYPIVGYIRYFLESFRPEIRQYFLEGNEEEVPFSREQRAVVYDRAKNLSNIKSFGSLVNFNQPGAEWFLQSGAVKELKNSDFRIMIGEGQCKKPYNASILNSSAMSFGSLSGKAIESINKGAKKGGFAQNTGEGSISKYHRRHGGDLIWQIGTGYFGCRNADAGFDESQFIESAQLDCVKMIELKLSQGAKPGKGGVLPAAKVTPAIAEARRIPVHQDCISPPVHSAFNSPREMIRFIAKLRELSGGKPVGIKLCVGQPWEFMAIAKAMIEEQSHPDYIVIDGTEGGTGAAPTEYLNHIGMPLLDGFLFVQNVLRGAGLRDKVKLCVSGKLIDAFDIGKILALGADLCNSARGFMFSVGCIQSRSCHTGECPTGVATQDPVRQHAINVDNKAERAFHFHKNTLKALASIVGTVGYTHPKSLQPHHIARREQDGHIQLLSHHFYWTDIGALLQGKGREHYQIMWDAADADHFDFPELPDLHSKDYSMRQRNEVSIFSNSI